MPSFILSGSFEKIKNFLDNYIAENKFQPYEVEAFNGNIKIEDARKIRKSLSFKVNGKKLIILDGQLTIECQNALLKSIEEADSKVHFVFCVERHDQLLQTIASRCRHIPLLSKVEYDQNIYGAVQDIKGRLDDWDSLDLVAEIVKERGLEVLLPVLRALLIESVSAERDSKPYYLFCKNTLSQIPFSQNNISEKNTLESIFRQSI